MGKVFIGAALLAGVALGAAGSAIAQTGPGGPGPGAGGPPHDGPEGWGEMDHMDHMDHMGHGHGGHGMRPMPRGAMFAITRGDTRIMIKCPDREPTRACVDAASALLDKVGGAATTGTGTR